MCYQAIRCAECHSDRFSAHLTGSNGRTSALVVCYDCGAVLFDGKPQVNQTRRQGQWQRQMINGMVRVAEDIVKGLVNFAFPTKPQYWDNWVKCQYTGRWEKVQLSKQY